MTDNTILLTDGYKFTHWRQYPPGTEYIYSYLEARGGEFGKTMFFGLQYYLQKYLAGVVVTRDMIEEADKLAQTYFGSNQFNREMWEYIVENHGGRLPLKIEAVPEGAVVPYSNVLMTVVNTDPRCYALTNWAETLLMKVWYPMTVATKSYEIRKILEKWADKTVGNQDHLNWQLHDFGYRGVSSEESASIGGAAHLLNFWGTDTMAGITMLMRYYAAEGFFAGSVPAAEHSTITSWGRDRELDAYRNMLEAYPTGIVSVVSDSYDIFDACRNLWGKELKDKVLARDGVLVIRPDSGDPVEVVPRILQILAHRFGTEQTEKGYTVLNPHVRVIQGDGVNARSIDAILDAMADHDFAANNVVFGMGGALLQQCDRDTHKFAFKCSWAQIMGKEVDVYKDPVGDPGKKSKRGRLALTRQFGEYSTVTWTPAIANNGRLRTVFLNGECQNLENLDRIRQRSAVS